jgi:peptidoglycan hydrolase-like protein with peptidoglycan-binding domain
MTHRPLVGSILALLLVPAGFAAHARQTAATQSSSVTTKVSTHKHRRRHHSEPAQKAPTRDRISEIQSALSRAGYYQGDPNGKWDANTVAAMQKFQSANGIDATGKLDAPTLQRLGLGSDIAGVSAPRPVVPGTTEPPAPAAPPAVPLANGLASPHSDSSSSLPASASNSGAASASGPPPAAH